MRIKGAQSSKNSQSIQSVGAAQAQAPMGAENEQNLREQFKAAMETFAGMHTANDSREIPLDTFQVESVERISSDATRISEYVHATNKIEQIKEQVERSDTLESVTTQDSGEIAARTLPSEAMNRPDMGTEKETKGEQSTPEVASQVINAQSEEQPGNETTDPFAAAKVSETTNLESSEIVETTKLAESIENIITNNEDQSADNKESEGTVDIELAAQEPELAQTKAPVTEDSIVQPEATLKIEGFSEPKTIRSEIESKPTNVSELSKALTAVTTPNAQEKLSQINEQNPEITSKALENTTATPIEKAALSLTPTFSPTLTSTVMKSTANKDLMEHAVQGSEIKKALALSADKATTQSNNQFQAFGFSHSAQNNGKSSEAKLLRNIPRPIADKALERVENTLKEIARSKDGKTISLRLDPPELGSVKIDVSLRDGTLHARIVAESPQVSNLLREKSHDLHSMLRKLGLDVDNISVSVRSDDNREQSFSFEQQNTAKDEGSLNREGNNSRDNQSAENNFVPNKNPQTTQTLDHWVA